MTGATPVRVDPATVGQYTGKKNLYDGDIFLAGDGKVPTLVFWNDANSAWGVRNLKRNEDYEMNKHFARFLSDAVGNKWDNPELMEESPC